MIVIKILDIDMDYFVNETAHCIPKFCQERLSEEDYSVWNKGEIETFLIENFGLSKNRKIKGRVVTHHDEALFFWRELINASKLSQPFDVIHVDAHGDLGVGYGSWVFIFDNLLGIPPKERIEIENYKNIFAEYREPDIGDYLLFALAFQWLSSLTYVCGADGVDDYHPYIIKGDMIQNEGIIQIPHNNTMSAVNMNYKEKKDVYLSVEMLEPEIPFKVINLKENVMFAGDYDFISFAVSPNYTPQSADFIIDIIKQFIDEI